MRSRRLLVLTPLVAALAGCGTATSHGESDPVPAQSSSPSSPSPTGPVVVEQARQVAIITVSAANGRASADVVRIDSVGAARAFGRSFDNTSMTHRLATTARKADLAPGEALVAAVVSVGCGVPDRVVITTLAGRLQVAAAPIENSPPECLVAMTSVGVVAVPEALAPAAD